ncbi:multidrug ABC transporter ATP-binding protein [Aliidongia dinghuensis]|uniref:Multidrug ABC transporter ATP-binding protein n=1 Tax=Aliidongia dinghuensis TaxID=1867774 RepID=A0A8J2YV74_9PROT|nr:ABC transporter ATP-binding protein [Aliidongia dinghuensis]GGF26858.1 multidrug ABC transporter ATP-binding protein [Aliidongia dinghuensis]
MSALSPTVRSALRPEPEPENVRRFVLRHLAADLPRVLWFVFGQVMFVGLTVASTRLIGDAVDLAGHDTALATFVARFGAILGVFALAVLFRWLADRAINGHTADAMAAIYQAGFEKCQGFDTSWHADAFAGSTARKVTRGAQGYDIFVSVCYFLFLPSVLLVLITAATIVGDSALASTAMLLGAVVYFTAIGWFNLTRVMPLMKEAFAQDSKITGELVDVLGNNAAVKSWAMEPNEQGRFHKVVGTWHAKILRGWNGAVNSGALSSSISSVVLILPIAIVVIEARSGLVEAGTVAMVIGAGFVLRGWLGNMGQGMREAQNAVSEMTELLTLLTRPNEAEEDAGLAEFKPGPGAIRFDRLCFRYAEANGAVFEDLSVEIEAGQTVALVGPSGSGKSTFVKLLLGLYRPDGGRILIDDQDVGLCTRASVRREIALVPQDPVLFHRTIADNIAYGAPAATREAIRDAARRARLDDMILGLPDGYETLVGERGVKLSGGERQRVAIARALVAPRPVLVFDEATSSLDTANEQAIQQALGQAMRDRTTIIVAHRLSTVRHADRILVFDRGRIVEDGSHEQLAKRPGGLYARLLDADREQRAA